MRSASNAERKTNNFLQRHMGLEDVASVDECKHRRLSDWETEDFDDNCEGVQVRRCLDCHEIVKKREISSDCTKERF